MCARRKLKESLGAETVLPGGISKESANLLQKDLDQLRRNYIAVARGSVQFGILFAALFELASNLDNIRKLNDFLARFPRPSKPKLGWDFTAGLGTADATVIVTALLLFVATLNVALAAFRIKERDSSESSATSYVWELMASRVATLASALSLAIAITQIAHSLSLFLILLGVGALTSVVTGSIPEPSVPAQLEVKRLGLKSRSEEIEEAAKALWARTATTQYEIHLARETLKHYFRNATLLAMGVGFAAGTLIIVTVSATTPSAVRAADAAEWLLIVLRLFLPLGLVFGTITWVFGAILVMTLYAGSRHWTVRYRSLAAAYAVVAVAWILSILLGVPTNTAVGWVINVEAGFIPPLGVYLASLVGRPKGWGTRRAIQRAALGLLVAQANELAAATERNRVKLATALEDARRRDALANRNA